MGNFYIQHEYRFAAVQLILAMFGMGATLTADDFRDVLRESKAVSFATAGQLLLLPVISLAFMTTSAVAGSVAAGIALIAAIPRGTTSNIFTHKARGNVPLSISVTGMTTPGWTSPRSGAGCTASGFCPRSP